MKFPLHVQELLEKRYFLSGEMYKKFYGETGTETWEQLCNRVAKTIGNEEYPAEIFFNMMYNLEFLPNSPTLFGAGLPGLCLSACFIIPVEDSVEGWMNSYRIAAKVQTHGGGCGFPLHKLRPKGFEIVGKRAKAAGPIEFMRCWNQISKSFSQGPRSGANMGQMRVDHVDIENFIDCKSKDGEISAFNISVMITDEFLNAVKNNEQFDLKWNGKTVKTISAKQLWEKIIYGAWKNGDPGIMFWDSIQKAKHPNILEDLYGNPCSEYNGPEGGACNLGSINLLSCCDKETRNFDFVKLEKLTINAHRFLNRVIDVNHYPDPMIEEVVKKYRQIGIGVMGLADVFLLKGFVYGDEASKNITAAIFSVIKDAANKENERRNNINTMMLSIAPTGTISMIAGVSSGIEPVFSFKPITRLIDGEEKILSEVAKSDNELANVCANDISIDAHLDITGIVQKYVDMSISKTINLPNNAPVDSVKYAYERAWELGLKGITVYRDGSRGNQPIQTKEPVFSMSSPKDHPLDTIGPVKRSGILSGKTFKDRIGCGYIYTTVNHTDAKDIIEVFIKPGKTGGCHSNVEGLGRIISLSLRCGVQVEEIIKQLKGIRCPSCIVKKDEVRYLSCPDAIAKAIEFKYRRLKNKKAVMVEIKNACPECGHEIINEGGCNICKNCGYSKCG